MNDALELIKKYQRSDTVYQLKNSFKDKTVFEILGVGRNEVSHSNFLAWLFNPNESHDLGMFPLEKFLFILASKEEYTNSERLVMPMKLQNLIAVGSVKIKKVDIQREVCASDSCNLKGKDRVDIILDLFIEPIKKSEITANIDDQCNISWIRIVLENKVFSAENGRDGTQTKIYFNHFENERKSHNEQWCIYAYLTPINRPRCSDNHFIHITYQDIFNNILNPISKMRNLKMQTKFVINEYIKNLSITTDSKNTIPMAMEKEQRELLIKFWNENKELIVACIDAFLESGENDDVDVETFHRVAEGLRQIKNAGHINHYIYTYNGVKSSKPLGQARLVLDIIKTYATVNKCSIDDLEKVFPSRLQKGFGKFGCFKEKGKLVQKEKKPKRRFYLDDPITLADGKEIVVCTEWGTKKEKNGNLVNFPIFKEAAKNLGFDIQQVD